MIIMATFDTIMTKLNCPRCGHYGEFKIQAYLPSANCFTYKIGDPIINIKRKKVPECGIYEGYAECPSCEKDFHLLVSVEDKKVSSIEIDKSKKGYIE